MAMNGRAIECVDAHGHMQIVHGFYSKSLSRKQPNMEGNVFHFGADRRERICYVRPGRGLMEIVQAA